MVFLRCLRNCCGWRAISPMLATPRSSRHSQGMHHDYNHSRIAANAWIAQHAHSIAPRARALDLACGGGRHSRMLLQRGCCVTAVDTDLGGIADLAINPRATLLHADLEN